MEPIKQEIINNIFENGDKLITGPILQTVLIDMIDDVNVKDQEILSKTGSWDDAATQIPNLATKAEVTNLSESVARDLENVVGGDLTGYATEQWVESQGYLKEHQDISNLATKTELTEAENNLQGNITSLSESVARDIANVSVPEGVATEAWVQSQDYASKSYVDNAVSSSSVDLTGYATETWVQNQDYLTEHQDISNLATKGELNEAKSTLESNLNNLSSSVSNDIQNKGEEVKTWVQSQGYLTEHQDISNLATKAELTSVSESVQTDISNLSESVANSVVWKKGTGKDSAVLILTGADEANTSTATGTGSVAIGSQTEAAGLYSHAEGERTSTSGPYSHAEGQSTEASGYGSHVEGTYTNAKGAYSHAEGLSSKASGMYSHAEGQSTEASGKASHAEGSGTKASGSCSHAEGYYAKALGDFSHAEGTYVTASGYYSHAEGDNTKAEGESSHAEGYKASATGRYGHAEGDTSNASGLCSHAEGQSTLSSGQASHAEGFFTVASNDYEHAQGQYNHNSTNQIFSVGAGEKIGETVTRRNAVSILEVPNSETQVVTASFFVQNIGGYDGTNPEPGTNDLATVINNLPSGGGSSETLWKKGTGTDSVVQAIASETDQPIATGKGAVAIGTATNASGEFSHAEGYNAKASGYASHAEGSYTNALIPYSHAEGWFTKTSGQASHAEGKTTKASGKYSHAEGDSTNASNECEHAQGRYNYTSSNQIFSIGTGNSDTDRRNAVSVLEVNNSGSYTSSFFVQNVGGYDGTNPEPGTNDLATVINNLPSGGSSETLWKKGTGQDSIVQVITDGSTPIPSATGKRAIATGYRATASGDYSYAEGNSTASGSYSHAEGHGTVASGIASHAEGYYTTASNTSEHAQGRFNHSSENQIFSVGAGEWGDISNPLGNRRNAISVLAVPNADTKINTASFFVQNIGGYDGTNPEPGTNDLATVINGMSSGGGSSETLWEKGEGTDSIVQKLPTISTVGVYSTPTATGEGAIATGYSKASGDRSHAEGYNTLASGVNSHAEGNSTKAEGSNSHAKGFYTKASGWYSHAEGKFTNTLGEGSHAEGFHTTASNDCEHAQGRYNHNSENQIFSIGTGNSDTDRRNVVSVLEVSNNNSYTGSFFVQNIGGYDGTNPEPGTNDLATVLNNTETWTFTLEDGSTVTKNVILG